MNILDHYNWIVDILFDFWGMGGFFFGGGGGWDGVESTSLQVPDLVVQHGIWRGGGGGWGVSRYQCSAGLQPYNQFNWPRN